MVIGAKQYLLSTQIECWNDIKDATIALKNTIQGRK